MRSSFLRSIFGIGVLTLVGVSSQACDGGGGSGASGDPGGSGGGSGGGGGDGGIACGPGAELCGDTCTVTALDPENCGQCGNACAAGETCDQGACVLACAGGATKCGESCVDTLSDPANCGQCGNACGALEVCSQGACGSACLGGTTQCGQACVDTDVDPDNCGQCGTACDATDEVCEAGQCVARCGDGLTFCGDRCADTMTDAANCGQCGNPCAGADECVAGQCVTPVPPKGVYTMSNDPSGNQILAFARAADGTLSPTGTFTPTGGKGTGAGLGNQHGLIFDPALNRFFAVNAGDDSISMLSLELDGTLRLLHHVDAGGVRPISVTVSGSLVYVLNAGVAGTAAGNITGFKITGDTLVPIAGSTQPLSAANPNPAQIQFSPDGKVLVVTEKGTNTLDTYTLAGDVATGPVITQSAGQTPFGFDFSKNQQVIVSEAWGGQANMSSTSSYALGQNGMLTAVSSAVPTTRTAACWLVVAGSFAYVANAQTGDITGFGVAADGTLSLLDPSGVTAQAGKGPVDEDVTDDNDFLYVVNNGDHSFSIFQINPDGSLSKKPDFLGLPSVVSGIVAR